MFGETYYNGYGYNFYYGGYGYYEYSVHPGGISKGTIALIIFLGVGCCACLIFIIYPNGLHRFSIKDSECE